MATDSTPFSLDAGLLDDLIEGRRVDAASSELLALAGLAVTTQRLRPTGPAIEQRVRMSERFNQVMDRGRAPGLFGFLGLGYAGRRLAQRMAAGAILLSVAGGATYAATGVSPVEFIQGTADLARNVVVNLNPNQDPGSPPSADPTDDGTSREPSTESTPSVNASATAGPPTATSAPASASETQTFSALQAGSVTLERSGANLTVVSTAPNEGWTVELDRPTGTDIEVSFTAGGTEVRFEATVVEGTIIPSVEERAADGGGNSGSDDDDDSGTGSDDDDDDDGGDDDSGGDD